MKHEIETALKTAGITYATLGICGMVALPVTQAVAVVAASACVAAVAGVIGYFLTRPIPSH